MKQTNTRMKKFAAPRALDLVEAILKKKYKETRKRKFHYAVPGLWSADAKTAKKEAVHPFKYYLDAVRKAKRAKPAKKGRPTGGEWTKEAVIYNMFVRTTAAFDHNGDGALNLPINGEGFRETGTFLKAIAMLPYIKRLGANTVHLLPITSIGHDGNKGTLGSPYAIRNPYEIDDNLAEPLLGLDAKTEFKAFVEAAHRMGLRVVAEFVFRTSAKDGDWVKEHPEWMYWIKDEIPLRQPGSSEEAHYGSPVFTQEELGRIHNAVEQKRFHELPGPHEQYTNFFTAPPAPEQVKKEDGRYVGILPGGQRVKIPGAFADWPPDDKQPPWGDVTYLRMYDHPGFNYIGYNTIRMYDARLATRENVNRPLWDRIVGIIPYYQREFGIDGVMIDMGHALPMEIKSEMVAAARKVDSDFAFWDENFSITAKSREEGYNAVFGYLWVDEHHADRMKNFLDRLAGEGFAIPFFGTPENHNTPRAAARPGGIAYARWSLVMNSFMPTVPFIHSGFELGETYPINTGLDFTAEQTAQLPSERLPLFSEYAYDWTSKKQFARFVRAVFAARKQYAKIVTDHAPSTVKILHDDNQAIIAFARVDRSGNKGVAVVGNTNYAGDEKTSVKITARGKSMTDLLTGKRIPVKEGAVHITLKPGACVVLEL